MEGESEKESWAIVEMMGHRVAAGKLSEEERFGSKVGRLDIPDESAGFATIYFNSQSIYCITVVTEEVARAKAKEHKLRPVYTWKVPEGQTVEEPVRAIAGPKASFPDHEGSGDYFGRDDEDPGF